MKVLIATKETQGQRDNDFNYCDENELLTLCGCTCDFECIDDDCGCHRSMCGVNTRKCTTTMKIVERDISKQQLLKLLIESISKAWPMLEEQAVNYASLDLNDLTQICNNFPVGSIIEKRGNEFFIRNKK